MDSINFHKVINWQRETFRHATALSKIAHLKQELEELEADIKEDKDSRLEFADCFILLFGAAECEGMTYSSIQMCIENKMEINYNRKWGDPDENGVVNHIK
ncbi:hypothetical protein LCGC14_0370500 [marine sediment metagenome]|uniref:dATP/dGTP diphosphohydrolase MazZ domain-containing protein n=1 Tax=marine sediment metagenome TaxID=412755 RepID=A0A0F9TB31_9ZZZZ|nr:dATP/dGTP pyrophosphohydrolase domain-containing protein [Maribacter sp.]HDZ04885.1 DUF550 domain-containing protein [Maribacter sp.]